MELGVSGSSLQVYHIGYHGLRLFFEGCLESSSSESRPLKHSGMNLWQTLCTNRDVNIRSFVVPILQRVFSCPPELILNRAVNETTHNYIILYFMERWWHFGRLCKLPCIEWKNNTLCFQWDWHIARQCKAMLFLDEAVDGLNISKPNVESAVSKFNCLCWI